MFKTALTKILHRKNLLDTATDNYYPFFLSAALAVASFCTLFHCGQLSGPCEIAWLAGGQPTGRFSAFFRMDSEWAALKKFLQ